MMRWTRTTQYLGALGVAAIAIAAAAVFADAHDLFLRPKDFIVSPGSDVHVRVLNGTFSSSESQVARLRLGDLSVVSDGQAVHPDTNTWTGGDKESAWHVRVGKPGTYLLGASVRPNTIRLSGTDFNHYLRDDGLPDVLAARRAAGTLDVAAHERYSKHVKALVRVETAATRRTPSSGDSSFARVLGYPAEIVPLADPYLLRPGASLDVRALVDGAPVTGQVVLAGGRTAKGARFPERMVRTDERGIARIPLRAAGVWYVKFINMRAVPAAAGDSVNYESKWATLTFAVR